VNPRTFALGAGVAALLVGCGAEGLVVASRSDPFIYVVLNQRAGGASQSIDQRALLLTVGSPTYSEYLTATRFEMTRSNDAARFVWRHLGQTGRAPVDATNASLLSGNYALPDARVGSSLGATDMVPGDSFDLVMAIDATTITGAALIPEAPVPVVTVQDGRSVIAWPPAPGAAAYSVEVSGLTAPIVQEDTSFVLPAATTAASDIIVISLDRNLAAYVQDSSRSRSGISAGYGVFGAISRAVIRISGGRSLAP
jgi:hypothetical protein